MAAQTDETACETRRDRITLRFMTLPQEATVSGASIASGRVLEWIDRAGYAAAVGWSSRYCVTAYVGNVHFDRPIPPGSIVEAHAHVVHTGRTSMHVVVDVSFADVRTGVYRHATDCILVFVAVADDGRPTTVPQWEPQDEHDRQLSTAAMDRVAIRREIKAAMMAQDYTEQGTTPRTLLRFLAQPLDANWGGNAHGGTVMRWISESAFAVAASWAGTGAVGVYSGGIHFHAPIAIGDIVEVESRIIHTGLHSMHIATQVHSANPRTPHDRTLTTRCMSVFVVPDADGHAAEIPQIEIITDEDRRLDAHAVALVEMRRRMPAMPDSRRS